MENHIMENNSLVLFDEKCRLCLENRGCHLILDNNSNLRRDVFVHTGIKVKSNDALPQKICILCFDVIEKIRQLKIVALKNDISLRQLFGKEASDTEISDASTVVVDNKENNNNKEKEPNDQNNHEKTVEPSASTESSTIEQHTSCSSISDVKKKKKKSRRRRENHIDSKRKTKLSPFKIRLVEPFKNRGLKMKIRRSNYEDFDCDICSKNFETRKKLYLHQRQHNKNIMCPVDVCGKKFSTKADLAKHVRTHTGEKPYKCDICDKGFTQSGTLKQHKENVHLNYTR